MDTSSYDNKIIIRKLYKEDEEYFIKILTENRRLAADWQEIYPFHLDWIEKVIKELRQEKGGRIALGGFYNSPDGGQVMCCSVILKKAEFSDYLEIKNLLVFDINPEADAENALRYYQRDMIQYIRKFAEQRGYPRLVTEIPKKGKYNTELIKVFLKKDFSITGSWLDRYFKYDQVSILCSDVNPICGQDTYDSKGIARWIISKYLKAEDIEVDDVKIFDEKNRSSLIEGYTFYIGSRFPSNTTTGRFNIKCKVAVIPESFFSVNDMDIIESIHVEGNSDDIAKYYVFNFSKNSLVENVTLYDVKNETDVSHKLIIVNRNELNDLIDVDKEILYRQRRFDFEEVGGLLLISNPKKFFANSNLADNVKEGYKSVYIKIGSYGECATQEMPLIFAYYTQDESGRTKLYIWGYARLFEMPYAVDIKKLRHKYREKHPRKPLPTDGKLLFDDIEGGNDLVTEDDAYRVRPIWDVQDFDNHNVFNATDRVTLFTISEFFDLSLSAKPIYLDQIDTVKDYLQSTYKKYYIRSFFDFYLSKAETVSITQFVPEEFNQTLDNLGPITNFK